MSIPTLTGPSNTNTSDSWENRIQNASVFLGIEPCQVEHLLKQLGVEKEPTGMEMLSDEEITPFGDLRKIFSDDMDVPLAKLRMAMKHLRGPKDSKKADSVDPETVKLKDKYGIKISLKNIPTEQLLEDYLPERKDHPITMVLKERFGNKPIIVFKPDSREIDMEATINYVTDLEDGFPEEKFVMSNGEPVCPLAVGHVPCDLVEEDPLFIGSPLKRGRSIANRANWNDVSKNIRQFVRIAVEMGVIDPEDRRDVRDVLQLASGSNALEELKKEFPEVALEYREREKLNNLPSLVMSMKEAQTARKQDPFGVKRQY